MANKEETIEMEGKVLEVLPGGQFRVELANKHTVTGLLMGQQEQRIRPSDPLPYNLRGFSSRITYGYKNKYYAEFDAGFNGSEQFAKGKRFGTFPGVS